MAQAYLSTRIVTPLGVRPGALLVEGGRIRAVCGVGEIPAGAVVHDCGQAALLPGLVDTHVHINEPGRTEWEGFATATRAAAAGGYTLLVDMPLNCLPETTTVAALEAKRSAAAAQCVVDWAAWGGAVADNQEHLLPLAHAGVLGFKCFLIYPGCDGFTVIDQQQLEVALPHIAASRLPLLVHAELAGPIDKAMKALGDADWRRYSTYLASRPDEAELEAIRLMIGLCRKYRFQLHIVHLSTARALAELQAARAEGLPVTVETCPHYLHFAAEHILDGNTLLKCAPPIRSQANREELWRGLLEETIDMVVTDHSPCPPEMKRVETGRFDLAWGGIAGLSVALAVMGTECARRGIGLDRLVRWMSSGPARLAGLSGIAGSLEAGREANFVVFDAEAEFTVEAANLHTRHAISPYVGERLRGVVRATYLRGETVYRAGEFPALGGGHEVRAGLIATGSKDGDEGVLEAWNRLRADQAARIILPCCGSRAWAEGLAASRPFLDEAELLAASDRVWCGLPKSAWIEAFDSHPRIGERKAQGDATPEALRWSEQEQSAAIEDGETRTLLDAGNREYEEKFGRIFIVCASGRSAPEILGILGGRLQNDQATELQEAAEQQRQITRLRLRRWLGGE